MESTPKCGLLKLSTLKCGFLKNKTQLWHHSIVLTVDSLHKSTVYVQIRRYLWIPAFTNLLFCNTKLAVRLACVYLLFLIKFQVRCDGCGMPNRSCLLLEHLISASFEGSHFCMAWTFFNWFCLCPWTLWYLVIRFQSLSSFLDNISGCSE